MAGPGRTRTSAIPWANVNGGFQARRSEAGGPAVDPEQSTVAEESQPETRRSRSRLTTERRAVAGRMGDGVPPR
jgi:hypothetical protein